MGNGVSLKGVKITAKIPVKNLNVTGTGMKVPQHGQYDEEFGWNLYKKDYFLSPEAVQFTAERTGVSLERAREYNNSIYSWSDRSYSTIRAYQRGEQFDEWRMEIAAKDAQRIEEFIGRSPRWAGGTTYRGVSTPKLPNIGDKIDMGGTSSWSNILEKAETFTWKRNEGDFRVVFMSNTNRNGTAISHLAKLKKESEVIVSQKSSYRVEGITQKGEIYYVQLKEL